MHPSEDAAANEPSGIGHLPRIYTRRGAALLRLALLALMSLGVPLARSSHADVTSKKRVAILIFDGVEIIDYAGPYEVFGTANYDVFTVAQRKAPIKTVFGMEVMPQYSFADAPKADVVLVPGGDVSSPKSDRATLAWIRSEAKTASHTMSVCNGAFILANTGLLDGLSATTTAYWLPKFRASYPRIHVVDDRRFVDNGRMATTGGLSAGIDGALHLVTVIDGEGKAQLTALGMEYDWRPQDKFARPALADMQIPDFSLAPIGKWSVDQTKGSRDGWLMVLHGVSDRSAEEIMAFFAANLTSSGKWKTISASEGRDSMQSGWQFSGRDGKPWKGSVDLRPAVGPRGGYVVRLSIWRAA